MSAWSLLAVPLCLGGIVLLLVGMSWFEQRLLSPSSLIVYTARSRNMAPDFVEQLVAAQSEELLRDRGLVRVKTRAAPGATEVMAVANVDTVTPATATAAAAQAAPAATRP